MARARSGRGVRRLCDGESSASTTHRAHHRPAGLRRDARAGPRSRASRSSSTSRGRGEPHEALLPRLIDLLRERLARRARRGRCDAASARRSRACSRAALGESRVDAREVHAESKSQLGFGLIAAVNGGRLKVYRGDGSPEHREFWRQCERARVAYRANRTMNFFVDPADGHDDYLVSAALLVHASLGRTRAARPRRRGCARSRDESRRGAVVVPPGAGTLRSSSSREDWGTRPRPPVRGLCPEVYPRRSCGRPPLRGPRSDDTRSAAPACEEHSTMVALHKDDAPHRTGSAAQAPHARAARDHRRATSRCAASRRARCPTARSTRTPAASSRRAASPARSTPASTTTRRRSSSTPPAATARSPACAATIACRSRC